MLKKFTGNPYNYLNLKIYFKSSWASDSSSCQRIVSKGIFSFSLINHLSPIYNIESEI